MSNYGWEQEHARVPGVQLEQVLAAYATRGGNLFGARRSPDNPLTLTHVRWQTPDGDGLETSRQADDQSLDAAEREAWVQLALHLPTNVPMGANGQDAQWLPLTLDRSQANVLYAQLQRAAATRRPAWQPSPYSRPPLSEPFGSGNAMNRNPTGYPPPPSRPSARPLSNAGPTGPFPPRPAASPSEPLHRPRTMPPGAESLPNLGSGPIGAESRPPSDAAGWGQAYTRAPFDPPEVTVIPCVEVELPPVAPGTASRDYTRDFARDVAVHFSRAARAVGQTREVRGWMRGGRLVLAARMVMSLGSRAPTRAEVETASRLLAEALAQRTLPYTRMSIAEPSEWMQGVALPE